MVAFLTQPLHNKSPQRWHQSIPLIELYPAKLKPSLWQHIIWCKIGCQNVVNITPSVTQTVAITLGSNRFVYSINRFSSSNSIRQNCRSFVRPRIMWVIKTSQRVKIPHWKRKHTVQVRGCFNSYFDVINRFCTSNFIGQQTNQLYRHVLYDVKYNVKTWSPSIL